MGLKPSLQLPWVAYISWGLSVCFILIVSFFKDFIYLLLETGEGKQKERERNIRVVASSTPPIGYLDCNPGMCPDWESN